MPAIDTNGGGPNIGIDGQVMDTTGRATLTFEPPPARLWIILAVPAAMFVLAGLASCIATRYGNRPRAPILMSVDKVDAAFRRKRRPFLVHFIVFWGSLLWGILNIVTWPIRWILFGMVYLLLSCLWEGCFGFCVGRGLVRSFMWGSMEGRASPRMLTKVEGREQVKRMFGLGSRSRPAVPACVTEQPDAQYRRAEERADALRRERERVSRANSSGRWVVGPNGEAVPPRAQIPPSRVEERAEAGRRERLSRVNSASQWVVGPNGEAVPPGGRIPPRNEIQRPVRLREEPAAARPQPQASRRPEAPAVERPQPRPRQPRVTGNQGDDGVRNAKSWVWVNFSSNMWMTARNGEPIAPGGRVSAGEFLRSKGIKMGNHKLPLEVLNCFGMTTYPTQPQ